MCYICFDFQLVCLCAEGPKNCFTIAVPTLYGPAYAYQIVTQAVKLTVEKEVGNDCGQPYKNIGTTIILYHVNIISLLLVLNVHGIVPHTYWYL